MFRRERRKEVRRQSDRELLEKLAWSQGQEGSEEDRSLRQMRRRAIRHHCAVRLALQFKHRAGGMDTWTTSEQEIKGRILDLSELGCSVFTEQPIDIGQELTLKLVLGKSGKVTSGGVVRWTKAVKQRNGFALGVQFAGLQKKELKCIAAFMKEMDQTIGL